MCNSFLGDWRNEEIFLKYVANANGFEKCEIWDNYRYNDTNNLTVHFNPRPRTFDMAEVCHNSGSLDECYLDMAYVDNP